MAVIHLLIREWYCPTLQCLSESADPNRDHSSSKWASFPFTIDDLRARGTPVQLHWIPAHTNIKGNEEADVAAKEATVWRRAKRRNGKWKEWDSGYTAEKRALGRARATIRLASEQKTCELWEEAWSNEKTARELYAICPKPTKKTLKVHKGLCVGVQVSCSAEDNSAIRDGRLGWSHSYFRLLNIAGHLYVYNRTSPLPKQSSNLPIISIIPFNTLQSG